MKKLSISFYQSIKISLRLVADPRKEVVDSFFETVFQL
jgi:hypothetical protein